jgi:ectoine hydroxylase-related dioxygenase (phytanoyl-CoA dioxygenase family)
MIDATNEMTSRGDDPLRSDFERQGYVVVPGLVYGAGGALRMVKIAQLTRTDAGFRGLAHSTALVDVVERLIGRGARLFRDVVVVKPARTGGKLSFHQDSAYWDVEPPSLVSAWVALTDVPTEASPLQVIAKTHHALSEHGLVLRDRLRVPRRVTKFLRALVSRAGTGDNPGASGGSPVLWRLKTLVLARASRLLPVLADLQDFRAVPEVIAGATIRTLPVKAGDVIFFHSLLLHASSANQADHDRYADIISYMPAGARLTSSKEGDFPPARSHA